MTTWQDVVDGNFIGGDLEFTNTDGFMHRGPVKAIVLDEATDMLTIELDWIAIMDFGEGEWAKSPNDVEPSLSFIASHSKPNDIGDGRVHFSFIVPMVISIRATLFPWGGSKLPLSKVANRIYDPLEV